MGIVRKLAIRLLGSRSQRIHSEFGDVIVRTTMELEKSGELKIKNLLINWFVSLPWAWFEALFIKVDTWNKPLLAVLDNAQVINGEECALISQAFCLWHLEQLIRNEGNYSNCSTKEIEQWIKNQTTKGELVIEKLEGFRKILSNTSPDDWYFEYINEIIKALYTDHEKRSSMIDSLRLDSDLRAALMAYSVATITTTKRIQAH